jgi:putative hydrolase of the HAD superfamily
MGVIYPVGDDVANFLVPFIRKKSGLDDVEQIETLYIQASLGAFDADEFWRRVGLAPDLEDEYLEQLVLSDGLLEFLEAARPQFDQVACLSNDVSAWSRKLRNRFGLDRYINHWYISGDLGVRKPHLGIYRRMLNDLTVEPATVLFIDDRPKNLHAAGELGIQTVYYDPAHNGNGGGHKKVSRLTELLRR